METSDELYERNTYDANECLKVLALSVEAQDKAASEQGDNQGYISLASALGALETLSLEQKSITGSNTNPSGDG